MLWIVGGPSSVGKSTFMGSPRCREITGLGSDEPVVFPADHSRLEEGDPGYRPSMLYHYNILRPMWLRARPRGPTPTGDTDFGGDLRWHDLMARGLTMQAVVLVANKQTILERARSRETVEDPALKTRNRNEYSSERWVRFIERSDLLSLYRAWCAELRRRGVPYVIVDSSDDAYRIVEDEGRLPDIVNGAEPIQTKKEIKQILREHTFGYHRVDLPYGLRTRGADRSETRDLVLPESLEGKSVLDVGSALGYFSFEAEARGAERVVGVELDEDRFRDALILKQIKGSGVDFLRRDVVSDPLDETFDHVLLLNVIHHLAEPAHALRQLASVTRERLVVEFPTLADRKFRKTARLPFPSLLNRLPLVGVSSAREGVRQTFVFTPSAIERMLVDHERLFGTVRILRSPIPGRAIAVCHK